MTRTTATPSPDEIDEAKFAESGFSKTTVVRGATYQSEGRVSIFGLRVGEASLTFSARVRGSVATSYVTEIEVLRAGGRRMSIFGTCTCPVGLNCKHVAAAVLQWQRDAKREMATEPASIRAESPLQVVRPALSGPLARWLADLGDEVARADEAAQPRKRIVYVLTPGAAGTLGTQILSQALDAQGLPKGDVKPYDANNTTSPNPAKFLRASDLAIIPRIVRFGSAYGGPSRRFDLHGRDGTTLLDEILTTRRAYWLDPDGPALFPAEPRRGAGVWRVGNDGLQRFGFDVRDVPDAVVASLAPPHYVDARTGEVGPLETGLSDAVVRRLLAAPPVSPEEAPAVAEALANVLPPERTPGPSKVAPAIDTRPEPVPHARLTQRKLPGWQFGASRPGSWRGATPEPVPALELSFDYDGVRFAPDDPKRDASHYDGARIHRIHRDMAAETRRLKRLSDIGFTAFPVDWSYGRDNKRPAVLWLGAATRVDYVDLLLDHIPALEREGWIVEVDSAFPLQLARPDIGGFDLEIQESSEGSGVDWFDLSVGVSVGGERLDLLPMFSQLLARLPAGREQAALDELSAAADEGARVDVTLPDGRILPLALAEALPILGALLAVWGPAELAQGARLHAAQARDFADIAARLDGTVRVFGGERLKALAEELGGFRDRPPTPTPAWFAANLRPYQQTGLDWLQMLARAGFGGVLADDMGLGKTVQLLAHLAVEKAAGRLEAPALVVAPTSVLGNWRAEAERFTPELATLVHQGLDRAKDRLATDGVDLVITSYPLLARDRDLLLGRQWSIAVLDEAQTIRNPQSATATASFALQARQRVAMSGTPVENHLGDIWALMHFLNPGLLGDAKSFRARYRLPIEKRDDALVRAHLSRRLKPFLLRRTKAEVAADLPEKTELRETVVLGAAQRQLYEATRLVMQRKVREALDQRGLAKSAIIVLDALLKLRQACCDPRLVKTATKKMASGGSAKLDRLVELVAELKEEGRSALIFSQFTSMLDLIRAEFDARGWRYAWLTGSTVDRATPVATFQSGDVDLFLISLKAGGVGLNLTRADTVILYDPWWNPAVEAQAIDRAHRIGQTQKIFVHRLIAEGTIEEKMLELQARKRGFADALWDEDPGGVAALSDADIRALFD